MMRSKHFALFTLLAALAGGCSFPMQAPVLGFIYTGVQSGDEATGAGTATKRGEACASSILGLVATGEASIDQASKQAGITTVSYVDHSHSTILGLYSEYCTIVYGQ